MGREYDLVDDHWGGWIGRQPLFFVGTAPLDGEGHVNVSPKGPGGSLRVLDERTIAYLDVVGSGAETIAHLRENGRVVVMFCAFEGPPKILRLHGRGEEASGFDARKCEGYVGTSAGSIVGAALAGGVGPDARLGELPEQPVGEEAPESSENLATRTFRAGVSTAAAPVAALALPTMAPGGAFVRRLALGRVPRGTRSLRGLGSRIDSMGARWAGRRPVSAVELESGRRVLFGRDGAPRASVGQA